MLKFEEIVTHKDFDSFVFSFTNLYLCSIYKNADYFNVGIISQKSKDLIIKRALKLLEIIGECHSVQLVKDVLKNPIGLDSFDGMTSGEEYGETDWFDFITMLEQLLITSLFIVTKNPMDLVGINEQCDQSFSTKLQRINSVYNLKIINYFYYKGLFEINKEEPSNVQYRIASDEFGGVSADSGEGY